MPTIETQMTEIQEMGLPAQDHKGTRAEIYINFPTKPRSRSSA